MCGHYCGLMGGTDSFRDSRGLRESAVSPVVWERRAVLSEPARQLPKLVQPQAPRERWWFVEDVKGCSSGAPEGF
jgi:hypothetical protein